MHSTKEPLTSLDLNKVAVHAKKNIKFIFDGALEWRREFDAIFDFFDCLMKNRLSSPSYRFICSLNFK